ncbi:hypothetical protein Ancab_039316, partial [Ancistrocladus abbreviatus]
REAPWRIAHIISEIQDKKAGLCRLFFALVRRLFNTAAHSLGQRARPCKIRNQMDL